MIGLSLIRSDTGTAPVGFGLALGIPPNAAHAPDCDNNGGCTCARLSGQHFLVADTGNGRIDTAVLGRRNRAIDNQDDTLP